MKSKARKIVTNSRRATEGPGMPFRTNLMVSRPSFNGRGVSTWSRRLFIWKLWNLWMLKHRSSEDRPDVMRAVIWIRPVNRFELFCAMRFPNFLFYERGRLKLWPNCSAVLSLKFMCTNSYCLMFTLMNLKISLVSFSKNWGFADSPTSFKIEF